MITQTGPRRLNYEFLFADRVMKYYVSDFDKIIILLLLILNVVQQSVADADKKLDGFRIIIILQ